MDVRRIVCETEIHDTSSICSAKHYWLHKDQATEEIINIPGRIRTCNPEILYSYVFILEIDLGEVLHDFYDEYHHH